MKSTSFFQYSFLLLFTALLLASCNARKKTALFNDTDPINTDTLKSMLVLNDQGLGDYYRVKPEDQIVLKNLQDEEFLIESKARTTVVSGTEGSAGQPFEVDADGFVTLPQVGKVKVSGLNRKELNQKMQQVFEAKQTKNAIVDVTIINLKVTLLGEFNRQGNYLLQRDNIRLIDIIGEAGGLTTNADPKTLKIIRGDKANPERIYVNLNDINSLASKKLILQNNDIITIQQQKNIATANKLQGLNSLIQPVLVLLNLGLLILTITK